MAKIMNKTLLRYPWGQRILNQDKTCYSRYKETILDKANNRKVDNIEVKEIEIETSDKREEG